VLRRDKSFKVFDGRREKRYGTAACAKIRGFSRFEDWEDVCCLPDRGEVSLTNGVARKGGEIGDTPETQVFEVECCKAIRAHS
jgi:hypothetical protein